MMSKSKPEILDAVERRLAQLRALALSPTALSLFMPFFPHPVRIVQQGKLPSWRGTYRRGYARPLGAAVVLSLFWAVALVPAAMLSVGYILLSVPLWGYGVFGIREWYRNRTDMSKLATRESPEGIVSELDRYPGDESRHFRVDHLVKMTAGLELEELPGLIERRERARRRRTTSIDSDDDVVRMI